MTVGTRGRSATPAERTVHQVPVAAPEPHLSAAIRQPGIRLPRLIAELLASYADRPALAWWAAPYGHDTTGNHHTRQSSPRFDTLTYRDLGERIRALAAWHRDEQHPMHTGDIVAILGVSGPEYVLVDLTCAQSGLVTAPLPSNAPMNQLKAIVAEINPRMIATTPELLATALELSTAAEHAHTILVFDQRPGGHDHAAAIVEAQHLDETRDPVRIDTLDAAVTRGRDLPPAPLAEVDEDTLAMLIYTSGSTGTPKGAIYTERLVRALWLGAADTAAVSVNYLPLSHAAGRMSLFGVLARGGTACFTTDSDLSTLFDDIATIEPTELVLVPRVCEAVYEIGQHSAATGTGELTPADRDALRHKLFGSRLARVTCVSAPLTPQLRQFMSSLLGVSVHDGYGSAEAGGGLLTDGWVQRPPVLAYKLIDVPELGYHGSDRPHPRGELLLRTTTMIPGYFRRPDATDTAFDDDGFYRTGDIVAEIEPGRLTCVDRRNNVTKLAQGEFVAVAHIEAVCAASPLVHQIFVYADAERAYPLAVVVPTAAAAESSADDLESAVAESMRSAAHSAGLNSYEIPRAIIVELEPFSAAAGLLSEVGKPLRPRLTEKYATALARRYDDIERDKASRTRILLDTGDQRPPTETVLQAAAAVLGTSAELDAVFSDLGGDSLTAVAYSRLLSQIYGVPVPVATIIGSTNTLRSIADYIATHAAGTAPPLRDGDPGSPLRAADLTLEGFFTPPPTVRSEPASPHTVLITGATGYLGRLLVLEWARRLAPVNGTVICLVRADVPAAAGRRLWLNVSASHDLLHHLEESPTTIDVVCGDLGAPRLGLDEQTWQRLATEVDLIVHTAALVNHLLPYADLAGTNVAGTAEIIRLALTTRHKPVHYLSSVAVADDSYPLDEYGDIRLQSPTRTRGYAKGYANTKWASEVLLRIAHERFGLPVTVFRSSMILAHRHWPGVINLPDAFTRLLLSLLTTGIAPESFYHPETDPASAHYDGLPADFVAEAITTLGTVHTHGYRTYHVVNPHDDGVSLDVFVDWLIDAGHRIERISHHDTWFARFGTALRTLPDRQRRYSVFPLLDDYRQPFQAIPGSVLPVRRFDTDLRTHGIDGTKRIPTVSADLIAKYVADLRFHGLLAPPFPYADTRGR